MNKVSIVIVNFNGKKDTFQCIESVEKLQPASWRANYKLQIIVVDNGSEEEFKKDEITVLRNEKNLGFSGGNNVGIRYALGNGADYVMLLNNDTIVNQHLVEELLKVANLDKRIGVVVPKIYFAKGHEFHRERYKEEERGKVIWYAGGVIDWNNVVGIHRGVDKVDHGQYDKVEKTDFATGCCMLIKKEVFEHVGLFDEKYFLYYEDADFSMRAIRGEYKIVYMPKAFLWHINAGSTGGSGSALQDYYTTRNRMLFGMRYAPLRSKVALIRESVSLFFSGRNWQRVGVRDFYISRFGRGSFLI
ncbi:MAG: glycosyltransferase family 2 protein [Candidatus Levyibacteriota bacterium]|nr:MAG: glycosyltransferase family 2 protein [Candidatus Levybacteria bacterium]